MSVVLVGAGNLLPSSQLKYCRSALNLGSPYYTSSYSSTMANSTLRGALSIHGGNPQVSVLERFLYCGADNPVQFLIEKVIRARIYDSLYWKEQCFALTGMSRSQTSSSRLLSRMDQEDSTLTIVIAESIIDKTLECKAIGGVHDRQTPTAFMCLTLKLLQLQPEKEILIEYLLAEEFK